jgi:predicted TIM-barrel enzyme
LKIQAGADIGIKKIECTIGGSLGADELTLKDCARLEGLVIGDLSPLRQ